MSDDHLLNTMELFEKMARKGFKLNDKLYKNVNALEFLNYYSYMSEANKRRLR